MCSSKPHGWLRAEWPYRGLASRNWNGASDALKRNASWYQALRRIFVDDGYAAPKLCEDLKSIGRWMV